MTQEQIVEAIGEKFRTFGGGKVRTNNNPIAIALKDSELQFAAGVSVREVVDFVVAAALGELSLAPDKDEIITALEHRIRELEADRNQLQADIDQGLY